MTQAEIDVTKQHIAAIGRIAVSDAANGLIFEDDVILKSGFMSNLSSAIDQLPEDYDVFWQLMDVVPFATKWGWQTYLQTVLRVKVYWTNPTLCYQGSSSGEYPSNLR